MPVALSQQNVMTFYHLETSKNQVTITAHDDQQQIGSVAASWDPFFKTATFHTLVVAPDYRGKGIGQTLLSQLEKHLQSLQIKSLKIKYEGWHPESPILEHLLQKNGWEKPEPFVIRYFFHVPTFSPPWFQRPCIVPSGFEIFPWAETTEKEREWLQIGERQRTFPITVSPLRGTDPVEPINSLGLRYRGELVGWLITHRIAPDTIRYTAFYIHREHRNKRAAISLLIQSIRQQKQSPVPLALVEINLEYARRWWLGFVKKRLAPYAFKMQEIKTAYHFYSY
jgi:GNAT superfamily N-acetyltransferase